MHARLGSPSLNGGSAHRLTLACIVGAVCAVAALNASAQEMATSSDSIVPAGPGIIKEVLVTGIVDPWDTAFLPDGNMLYTERPGRIGIYFPATRAHRTIQGPPGEFHDDGFQAGMLGIAVDPEFATNRYIYTYMTSRVAVPGLPTHEVKDAAITAGKFTITSKGGHFVRTDQGRVARSQTEPVLTKGIVIDKFIDRSKVDLSRPPTVSASDVTLTIESVENRVVRWVLAADSSSLTRDADIVTGIPYGNQRFFGHHGGRIRFGPDGYLWIATGDGDVATNAQSGRSLGGKILRVDRNGRPAPGNNAPPGFDPRIYTYGHRNPQGIAFRSSDGQAFSVEHGDDFDDEVNLLVAGDNYGWVGDDVMTDLRKFPGARRAAWSSGDPTLAPSGATFVSNRAGADWKGWNGALAVAMLKTQRLIMMFFDSSDVVYATTLALVDPNWRLRSVVEGPDGSLYIATNAPRFGLPPYLKEGADTGEIWRITPK